MSGSQIDTGLELGESPLGSPTTALELDELTLGVNGLGDTPLDTVGDMVVPDWAPTLEAIAKLVPEFTRLKVDADGIEAGEESNRFGEDTDPTDQQVEGYIVAAVNTVVGRVGTTLSRLDSFPDLASATTKWLVVVLIERKLLTAGADDAQGAFQSAQREYLGCLTELQTQARRTLPRLI